MRVEMPGRFPTAPVMSELVNRNTVVLREVDDIPEEEAFRPADDPWARAVTGATELTEHEAEAAV